VLEHLQEGPPAKAQGLQPGRWTLRSLQEHVERLKGYSLGGIWRWLKRAGVSWRSASLRQWSPDPDYRSKLGTLCACLQAAGAAPGEIELIFLDEVGFYRWPIPANTWAANPPQPPPRAQHAGQTNNSQWRIIGGLNARTGQVTHRSNYIVGRKQVVQWYEQLNTTYPQARKIYVVQDNWSIHSHLDVLDALRQWPRIEPVWLPTYSPWLNPIEKLWRKLKVEVLKMHRLAQDWPELKRQAHLFLDQYLEGSHELLHYVGLLGEGILARALAGQL
jgi:transposase